jgi:hypothetical protein
LIAWAFSNPVYAGALLLGVLLGAFYGFDGWRGSPQDTELSESPKVKGMIWVLTVALTTVIGDVHALDAQARKPIVFLLYLAGVIAGAVVVVVGWGIFILVAHVRGSISADYPITQVMGDYLYYGYRYYDRERAKKDRAKKFQAPYFQQVAYVVTAVRPGLGDAQLRETARLILGAVTAVVRKYHGDEQLPIRSNLMRVGTCANGDDRYQRLQFLDGKPVDITQCLELVTYDDERSTSLLLPIPPDRNQEKALPGAPLAFLKGTAEIVDDTRAVTFPAGLPEGVRQAQIQYFNQHRFRSFASLCVVAKGRVVGVANVESDSTCVFGTTDEDKAYLTNCLLPFCSAFGILLS